MVSFNFLSELFVQRRERTRFGKGRTCYSCQKNDPRPSKTNVRGLFRRFMGSEKKKKALMKFALGKGAGAVASFGGK